MSRGNRDESPLEEIHEQVPLRNGDIARTTFIQRVGSGRNVRLMVHFTPDTASFGADKGVHVYSPDNLQKLKEAVKRAAQRSRHWPTRPRWQWLSTLTGGLVRVGYDANIVWEASSTTYYVVEPIHIPLRAKVRGLFKKKYTKK